MTDDLLLSVILGGGQRWESLLAKAVASHLRRSLAAGDERYEDVSGRLEDWLLDTLCSLRAVNAARGGRGDQGEALAEAGESIVRLSVCLTELRCESLAAAKRESTK